MPGADVVIPGSKIQRLAQDVMIVPIEEPHKVGGDELSRIRVFANDFDLNALIFVVLVRHKSLPLEHERGVVWANRDWNFSALDRKSTRLNSSHVEISYAVFCLK